MTLRTPRSTPFPYTTLFRSLVGVQVVRIVPGETDKTQCSAADQDEHQPESSGVDSRKAQCACFGAHLGVLNGRDRKSTRLNSSHLVISYAVFCLKKKKQSRL